MSEGEEQGFVIRDRRGQSSEEAAAGQSAKVSPTPTGETPDVSDLKTPSDYAESGPPLNFASFIFSLGSSALMLMGEKLTPEQPSPPVSLPQAKEIIEILSMLETKTQGNLSSEESTVLADMLYTLRMKYVDLVSGRPDSPSN